MKEGERKKRIPGFLVCFHAMREKNRDYNDNDNDDDDNDVRPCASHEALFDAHVLIQAGSRVWVWCGTELDTILYALSPDCSPLESPLSHA